MQQVLRHPVLMAGTPIQSWQRDTPIRKDEGTPCQEGWDIPLLERMGYPFHWEGWGMSHKVCPPLPKVEQTHTCENLTFRHPSDADGNHLVFVKLIPSSKFIGVSEHK